jgi:hypothetical protein
MPRFSLVVIGTLSAWSLLGGCSGFGDSSNDVGGGAGVSLAGTPTGATTGAGATAGQASALGGSSGGAAGESTNQGGDAGEIALGGGSASNRARTIPAWSRKLRTGNSS